MAIREIDASVWPMRRASVWVICCLLVISLAGCKEKIPPQPPPPKVTVAQPVRRAVTDYLELIGNTEATHTVQLVARVAGYLEKIFFRDGQPVKKGDLLFLIQQDTYKAQLQQAEGQIQLQKTQMDYAETELVRYSNLLSQKAASQVDVDNYRNQRDSARANLLTAEASRDLAKLNLAYTEIRAPFDGRIDRRLVDPGNLVGSGQNTVLAQLNQIDPIYVYFTISDLDLARLMESTHWGPGQIEGMKWPVSVGLATETGHPHQGHLDFASISLTSTTGTLLMRGIFPNPGGRILPGLYARVLVPLERKERFLVPDVAIGSDQQGTYVLVVDERNVVQRRSIKVSLSVDNLRAIEEGLSGNEWIVVNGLLKAVSGRKVTPDREAITPSQPPPPQPTEQEKVKP
jgi:RND family efflux transporter MFP subunit